MNPATLSRIYKFSLLIVVALLLMGCNLSLPMSRSDLSASPTSNSLAVSILPTPIALSASANTIDEQAVLVDLYARANPAVVNVTVFGQKGQQIVPLGQGSGFVYDQAGYIVTNAHVVRETQDVDVTFSDGTVRAAQIVGQDPNSDLAVLKTDELPEDISPLPLGEMSELAVGQTVIAIGNPFGLEGTLTRGVISALGRTIPALTPFAIPQAIQTDAAINPGNSGGPLLDLHGHVIGVNAQIETGSMSRSNSGVGFAIPVDIVRQVVPELIENGEYAWAWLGIRGGSVTPTLVKAMDLPIERGAYIAEVTPGGPAEQAGLRGADDTVLASGRLVDVGGDVIVAIDEQPVRSFEDLLIYIAMETTPGQDVTLTIIREGKQQDMSVQLRARPGSLE